jgi:hypothetical protein
VIGVGAGGLFAALAVTGVLLILRRPLLAVLIELCAGEHRALFWWRVLNVEVVAGTALCTSMAMLVVSRAQPWRSAAVMVQGSVAGLLVALAVVMVAVIMFERATTGA